MIACSSLIALLLLSCVGPYYYEPADTRRAGCSIRTSALASIRSHRMCCTLYLVFKEPRTDVACSSLRRYQPNVSPRRRAIQSLGFCPGPFWGNLPNLRRLALPCQPFFRLPRKIFGDLLLAARLPRPRRPRKSCFTNVGDRPFAVNPYRNLGRKLSF